MKKSYLLIIIPALILCACGTSSSLVSSSEGNPDIISSSDNETSSQSSSPVEENTNISELGKLRKSQNKNGLPQKGYANVLVVPVEFDGDSLYGFNITKDEVTSLTECYIDSNGSSSNQKSVCNFYADSSYGNLDLNCEISPTVTLSGEILDYIQEGEIHGYAQVFEEITQEVYEYLFEEITYYDISEFDADKDNKIDGMVLAYSWPDALSYYGSDIYDTLSSLLTEETYFESDLDFTCPLSSLTWASINYPLLTGIENDSHIYIREMGKMLGLENLLDSTGSTEGYVRAPLSLKDPMDGAIGDHNPFSKYALGWIDPQKVTTKDVEDELEITLEPYEESGDCLILSPEETGLFGEYLMVEYFTPTGLYKPNSSSVYPLYGTRTYGKAGIRVFKVDSRLVEGTSEDNVWAYNGTPDYNKIITYNNKANNAYYDFAYSNDGYNEYTSSGVYEDYILVGELSKREANRHFVSYENILNEQDLFLEGDTFGDDTELGYYKNYTFDNGDKLGLTFSVDSITSGEATLTIRRAA